jgi:hypothetical protein
MSSQNEVLSLYIPSGIMNYHTEEYITKHFIEHDIGKVMRVDFVKNIKKGDRREAFVHFDEWFDTEASIALQENVKNIDIKSRFVYQGNKFWPLLVNKNAHRRVTNPGYEVINSDDMKVTAVADIVIPTEPVNMEVSNKRACAWAWVREPVLGLGCLTQPSK